MKGMLFSFFVFAFIGHQCFAQSAELPSETPPPSNESRKEDPQVSCATPYANQMKALRNAQLRLTTPETGKTLAQLKDEHDKRVAQLILLKGLKQVRSDYLTALGTQSKKFEANIKSLDDLKKFTTDRQGEFKTIEKMLILEKGIQHLSSNQQLKVRSGEEFYHLLRSSCLSTTSTSETTTKEASKNLCEALDSIQHKDMIVSFYNIYKRGDPSPDELKKYLQYLRVVAKESDLEEELNAAKNLQLAIKGTTKKLEDCTASQGAQCKLHSDLMTAAYAQYKKALTKEAFSSDSAVLNNSLGNSENNFKIADEKIAEAKVFFEDVQTGDQKLVDPLESSKLYDDIQKKLSQFSKKNKHSGKDYSELLKSMRCEGTLFSENAPSSQLNAFNSCIKNMTDSVLDESIVNLNKEIEKFRNEIQTITTSPSWWESSTSKYTYNKYLDFSTAIHEVLAIMQKRCKIQNVVSERSYDLNSCGIKDFLPPEEATNLGHNVEKVLSGLQISSQRDPEKIRDICSRLRDYGETPPATLCDRGYDGQTPPPEIQLSDAPFVTPSENTEVSTSPPLSSEDRKIQETRSQANSYRSQQRAYTKSYPKMGAGDYAKAFASALGNSSAAMSTLSLWAQGPLFKTQLGWQVEMAKNQITAESYQQAWYKYYNQVQADAWANFLSSSNLNLYNGGPFYNFN